MKFAIIIFNLSIHFVNKYVKSNLVYKIFFNLILKLQGINDKVRLKRIENDVFFEIQNPALNWTFCFKEQGLYAFSRGIKKRAMTLGNIYCLNEINFFKNDIVIDIGANTGDLYLYFYFKDLGIQYVGIEPGIKEFHALKTNVTGTSVNAAIGNENERLKFYYKPDSGDSSLIEMAGFKNTYQVHVHKLTTLLDDLSLRNQRIKLLKLEAEGFEPEILEGAMDCISQIDYINADLGFERGINQDTTAPDVVNFLLSNNFEMVSLYYERTCILFKNKN